MSLSERELTLRRLSDDIIPIYDVECTESHQVDALRFLCTRKVSCLNGDVGTMKSKIAIDLCQSRFEAGEIDKVMVLCPVALIKNFKDQISTWGNKRSRLEWRVIGLESIAASGRIYLDAVQYVDDRTQIIVDESHLIKNPFAKRSKRTKMLSLKTSYKLIMTGTLVTENVHNLYMQYAILDDAITESRNYIDFENKFVILGGYTGYDVVGYKNMDLLTELIKPYTHRIDSNVLNLEPILSRDLYCELNYRQMDMYMRVKFELLDALSSDRFRSTDIFRAFTRMQQIVSGRYMGSKDSHLGTNKIDLLMSECNDGEKAVIFCKYIFEVDDIVNALGADRCVEFTGRNAYERDRVKSLFVSGDKQFFVASLRTGSAGINGLQEVCNKAIFYSLPFSYGDYRQAIGRLDRKGQLKRVEVVNLHTESGIDDRISRAIDRKEGISETVKRLMSRGKNELIRYIEKL